MPMNPRLLRPTQGGFSSPDADARAYLAAVRIADGSNLEPAVAKAISDFVVGCKADGIWDALKASCILAGARTLSGALVPLKGSAPTNDGPFVSGDYSRGGATPGLKGNGTSKSLNTNRQNDADGQDNRHISVYVTTLPTLNDRAYIGANTASSGASNIYRGGAAASNDLFTRLSAQTTYRQVGSATYSGFIAGVRTNSSNLSVRAGGVDATSGSNNSQAPSSLFLRVFSDSGTASAATAWTDARIAFYSIGESLTLATLDSRVTTLINAISAALP